MTKALPALVAMMGLAACQPAAAPAAGAQVAESLEPRAEAVDSKWELMLAPILTLAYGGDGLAIACEEAKGVMRISIATAWEKEGPFDAAVVRFGETDFPVSIDAGANVDASDTYRPVYLLPANADTVTAVMMADNATLTMTNAEGIQERSGEPDDSGAFDAFATTCAQLNGLR